MLEKISHLWNSLPQVVQKIICVFVLAICVLYCLGGTLTTLLYLLEAVIALFESGILYGLIAFLKFIGISIVTALSITGIIVCVNALRD